MRDFCEEYTNYIESDMPDLWSRIESNLKEKVVAVPEETGKAPEAEMQTPKKINSKAKIYRFVKIATPVAAGICILVIGIGVINISNKSMDSAPMEESAAASDVCAEEAYTEEAPAEFYVEEPVAEDRTTQTAETEEAAPATDMAENSEVQDKNSVVVTDETELFEAATLLSIDEAGPAAAEAGYPYVYVFTLEDGGDLSVYVTAQMYAVWEMSDTLPVCGEVYDLTVLKTSDNMETEGEPEAEYILYEPTLHP